MRKTFVMAVAAGGTALATLAGGVSVSAAAPTNQNGQIAFELYNQLPEEAVIAVVNPDGTHVETVSPPGVALGSPHWSPDGTRLAGTVPGSSVLAGFVENVETKAVVGFPNPADGFWDCFVWSSPGTRVACGSSGGIHTVRATDGGDAKQLTSNPDGDDIPGSFSPTGDRLVFLRSNEDGSGGLFVVNAHGSGLTRLTPPGALVDGDKFGDWSPQGNEIVFAQHNNAAVRNSIWVVHSDGSGLHEIHFDTPKPCGGARVDPDTRGCFDPTWSPDGKQIAFIVLDPSGEGESLYTANIDGTGLTQITHGSSENPDWGTHPLS